MKSSQGCLDTHCEYKKTASNESLLLSRLSGDVLPVCWTSALYSLRSLTATDSLNWRGRLAPPLAVNRTIWNRWCEEDTEDIYCPYWITRTTLSTTYCRDRGARSPTDCFSSASQEQIQENIPAHCNKTVQYINTLCTAFTLYFRYTVYTLIVITFLRFHFLYYLHS